MRVTGGLIALERGLVKHQVRVMMGDPEQPGEDAKMPDVMNGGTCRLTFQ